jgi:hypothetical protein
MKAKKVSKAFPDHDSPQHIYKSVYKYVDCGPSIGMRINGADLNCDNLPNKWEGDITHIYVSSIVEGVDYNCDTITVQIHPHKPVTQHWQAKFRAWIGQRKHGVVFIGARKNSRGEWLQGDNLPLTVKQFLHLEKHNGKWCCVYIKTLKNFKDKARRVKMQRGSNPIEVKFLFTVNDYEPMKTLTIAEIKNQFWNAVSEVNEQAQEIWLNTHGCEGCEKMWGIDPMDPATYLNDSPYTPVHPDCKECEGGGIII